MEETIDRHLLAVAAAFLLLTGCTPTDGPPPVDPNPTVEPTPPVGPTPSEESGLGEVEDEAGVEQIGGHILKALGEAGELVDEAGNPQFSMTIEAAEHATSCPSRSRGGEEIAGDFLVLHVAAGLSATYGGDDAESAEVFLPMMPEVFALLDGEGRVLERTGDDAAWDCYDDEDLLPAFLLPGADERGRVVLQGLTGVEYVAYSPRGASGWAWALPVEPR